MSSFANNTNMGILNKVSIIENNLPKAPNNRASTWRWHIQRCINVDATSWRCNDVDTMLSHRCVPAGKWRKKRNVPKWKQKSNMKKNGTATEIDGSAVKLLRDLNRFYIVSIFAWWSPPLCCHFFLSVDGVDFSILFMFEANAISSNVWA